MCLLCLASALCFGTSTMQSTNAAQPTQIPKHRALGLQVDSKGVLVKDGKPFRGIGVNCFNLFYRTITNPGDASYRDTLKTLEDNGIPFVRFAACGFWPVDFKLYREDRAKYFALMDGVVKSAEEHRIGLIPSFFWFYAAVPDMCGEPMDAWGDPKSKTSEFVRTYTREIVTRYRSSPAIWGWEFGNEFSLQADLPNAKDFRPHVDQNLGTAASRSDRDHLTHKMIRTAFTEFGKEVRRLDTHRIIITGNSFPRPSAWHQMTEHSWDLDTREQYEQMLLGDNPDPVNTLSGHMYTDVPTRFGGPITFDELLRTTMEISRKARKPLFVGEFGAQRQKDDAATKKLFSEMIAALEKNKVPISALWVFDYGPQDKDWNVTATNDRSWQLTAIADANRRTREGK